MKELGVRSYLFAVPAYHIDGDAGTAPPVCELLVKPMNVSLGSIVRT